MTFLQRLLLVCISMYSIALLAAPATLVVDLSGAGDFTAIQPAIDAAQTGDTVLVKAGEYVITEPINFTGKAITVRSDLGAEATTIRGGVVFQGGETIASLLDGFRLDGVICNSSSPVLVACEVRHRCGGVFCYDEASPMLVDCKISPLGEGCEAGGGGGGGLVCYSSSPTLVNCIISGNSGVGWRCRPYGGGVVCWNSSPSLSNCTITGNSVMGGCGGDPGGGGVYCSDGSAPRLTNCIIWNNIGGAIGMDESSHPIVSYSCIEGVEVWPGTGNIQADPQFCGWGAGEVWVDASRPGSGTGTRTDPYTSLNLALGGYSLGLKSRSPCRGTGKDGADIGAALGACDGGSVAIPIVHLAPGTYSTGDLRPLNPVSLEGAGQDVTVIEGTVSHLRTGSFLSRVKVTGGVIVGFGEAPEIRDCTISGDWHGVTCVGSAPRLSNCAIVGSQGVLCTNASPALINCNISGLDTGVRLGNSSHPTLKNCIVSSNISNDDSSSASVTYSCIQGGWPGDGNIDADPYFVLGEWWDLSTSPPTWIPGDYHLQLGSPCIDTGTCDGAPPLDIEGNVRPAGAACDMGAYEFGSFPTRPLFHRGDPNSSGSVDISDALAIFGYLFLGSDSPTCFESADVNNSGVIDISDGVVLLSWLFTGGSEPSPPGPTGAPCGVDPDAPGSAEDLGCESYSACQ